jgi:hypothetical protein
VRELRNNIERLLIPSGGDRRHHLGELAARGDRLQRAAARQRRRRASMSLPLREARATDKAHRID